MKKSDLTLCRCEVIIASEMRKAIQEETVNLNDIKKFVRWK